MKRRLRLAWTCSDHVHHEHRWRWVAWLCGRLQKHAGLALGLGALALFYGMFLVAWWLA